MSDPLAPLRARFRARAASDRAELDQLAAEPSSLELRRLAHNLAGAAGTFGYADLSAAARAVDDQMTSGEPADAALLDALKRQLDDVARTSP